MRIKRARTILVYWRNQELVFDNYRKRIAISADPVTVRVLHFCDRWCKPEQVVQALPEYSSESILRALTLLLDHSLLIRKGTEDAEQDERLANIWSDWLPYGSFHFATKDVNFLSQKHGRRLFEGYLRESAQPPFFKRYSGVTHLSLPTCLPIRGEFLNVLFRRKTHRNFSKANVSLEDVSRLLYYTWGVTGYHETLFGQLPHKTSPSGGARHPGEVYLLAMRVKGLPSGLYHYDPKAHRLNLLRKGQMRKKAAAYCVAQQHASRAAALFLMTAVFPRSMWKYRFARAYRVVTLDAGHLCQTLCLTATFLGLAPFCTAALKDTLIERDLGLDGITESVMYVAGVGLPLNPTKRAQKKKNT